MVIGSSSLGSFDGATAFPADPPSLAPGTYNIGTIVWDTSGASAGLSAIFFFLVSGIDGSAGVLPPASSNIVELTGSEVLGTGFINIIPEPSTAGLVAVALLGLGLSGRRRAQSKRPRPSS